MDVKRERCMCACGFRVKDGHQAIACDVCGKWSHRKCTGISAENYVRAVKGKIVIEYTCQSYDKVKYYSRN